MHGFYCRLTKLSLDRLLHKLYQIDKHLFLKGSKLWFTNIRNIEKLLNIQQLKNYNKDAFINVLQTFYRDKLEKSLEHIKKSSDSKLSLFCTLYSNFNVPCYLNMHLSKAKRSLLTKLRLSCHNLNIETLCYCRPKV